MIQFEKIRLKNFLSYGNAWTEVDLQQGNVLLCGVNGSGKSSVIGDSISFALFGKPFRKINIPQLINFVNQKDTCVELEFSIETVNYKIIRGLKPGKFEIYKENELIKQEAATKDYQSYLENQILKINHKTFVQILVLGSAVFTPFMQLPAAQRRGVIEDILDINVFSIMLKLLKERIQNTKEEMLLIDTKIDSAKKETISQKRLIETLADRNNGHIEALEDDLKKEFEILHTHESELASLKSVKSAMIQNLIEFDRDMLEHCMIEFSTLKRELKTSIDKIEKIETIVDCPTCLQHVGDEHKTMIRDKIQVDYNDKKPELDRLKGVIDKLSAAKESYTDLEHKIKLMSNQIDLVESQIINQDRRIIELKEKIEAQKSAAQSDVDTEKDKLRSLAQTALKLIERKNELLNEKALQEVSLGLLKDTGIKSSIIREYLPIINAMMNKYLEEFDFFIDFVLDENFDEKLLSRGRDAASYYSLSEGEKKRIDVAILMTFRYIASLKNSAKINLLVLDELDSGLDADSRVKLLDMIKALQTNVWVVSHSIQNTELEQMFDKVVTVVKKGEFSVLHQQ